jgi:hypothetical protein
MANFFNSFEYTVDNSEYTVFPEALSKKEAKEVLNKNRTLQADSSIGPTLNCADWKEAHIVFIKDYTNIMKSNSSKAKQIATLNTCLYIAGAGVTLAGGIVALTVTNNGIPGGVLSLVGGSLVATTATINLPSKLSIYNECANSLRKMLSDFSVKWKSCPADEGQMKEYDKDCMAITDFVVKSSCFGAY